MEEKIKSESDMISFKDKNRVNFPFFSTAFEFSNNKAN